MYRFNICTNHLVLIKIINKNWFCFVIRTTRFCTYLLVHPIRPLEKRYFPPYLEWKQFFGHCGGIIEHISENRFRVPICLQQKLLSPNYYNSLVKAYFAFWLLLRQVFDFKWLLLSQISYFSKIKHTDGLERVSSD